MDLDKYLGATFQAIDGTLFSLVGFDRSRGIVFLRAQPGKRETMRIADFDACLLAGTIVLRPFIGCIGL